MSAQKPLSFKKAMDLMNRGSRLVMMHTTDSPNGTAHYVVPGGYVEPRTAELIKEHPSVVAGKDGLFTEHHQTWRVLGHSETLL